MEDLLIIAVITILIMIGLRSTKKHFKGQGGCCGGSSTPAPKQKKKLKNVVQTKTVFIEGMTCEHCKNRVEKAVNDIDGAAAKVNLRKKEALVSLEREISDEELRTAIESAGYHVLEIRSKSSL